MLIRRRMMVESGGTPTPIFSLYNQATVAGDRFGTGYKPLNSSANLTILFDFNLTTNVTSGYGRLWKLINLYNNILGVTGFRIGKEKAASTLLSTWLNSSTATSWGGTKTSTGRHRIAVTHAAGATDWNLSYRKDTETRLNKTISATFTEDTTGQLFFGGGVNNDNSLPPGTITKAEVYDIVLPSAEINAFFA